jgi:hypothetical protein
VSPRVDKVTPTPDAYMGPGFEDETKSGRLIANSFEGLKCGPRIPVSAGETVRMEFPGVNFDYWEGGVQMTGSSETGSHSAKIPPDATPGSTFWMSARDGNGSRACFSLFVSEK